MRYLIVETANKEDFDLLVSFAKRFHYLFVIRPYI
jgi:hypothetical protein